MESETHAHAVPRDECLRRLGLDPSEADGLAGVVEAFCGAPAELILGEAPGPRPLPERTPGTSWSALRPGRTGRWIPRAGGGAWGLLAVEGPLDALRRAGVERAADLLGARLDRVRADRERRAAPRGPEGASFVPGLVHELRNAGFALSAALDALGARHPEAAEHQALLRRNLERLTGFVEELEAYGSPRAGAAELVSLPAILREAAAGCQVLAERLGSRASVSWEGGAAYLRADAAALRGAFTGLFRFALAQGGPGDALLHAESTPEGARGHLDPPGLRAGGLDLARAFEPFHYRAAGAGRLALPVLRRVLEAHGGTCRAQAAPDGGLRLAFTLPCA